MNTEEKKSDKFFLFCIGIMMIFWSLLVLLWKPIFSDPEMANTISFGLLKKLSLPGFEDLGIICFCFCFYFGMRIIRKSLEETTKDTEDKIKEEE